MGALFSRKRKGGDDGIDESDRAMLQIKVSKGRVQKHRNNIRRAIDREMQAARQLSAEGHRLRARDALRRRRYWEQALETTEQMLQKLDEVVAGIEMAKLNKEVYTGLAAGTAALKQMQAELSLDKVERLMDERADALAVQEAIDAALGTGAEAELEQQLERLESEALSSQLPSAPTAAARLNETSDALVSALPSPPQSAAAAHASEARGGPASTRGAMMYAG